MHISTESLNISREGKELVTARLQQAIDLIDATGGGTLVVTPGIYLTGTLVLPSDFTLQLDAGAELLASPTYSDYSAIETLTTAELSRTALLYARGQQHITVCGAGRINGNADAYFSEQANDQGYRMPHTCRPRMVVFEDCQQVKLQDFTVTASPMWTVHLVSCTQVEVARITIDNGLTQANTDALDIDSCQNVQISDSYFSAADDGICLKTTDKPAAIQRPIRNVTISNCIVRSKSCAIKLGTETFADIENVVVNNCTIFESNRGIGLISRDGGHFSNLIFSNITFQCGFAHPCHWGKSDPIFVSVRYRHPDIRPGTVRDVSFNHITGSCEGAVNLHSDPAGGIENVSFNQISLRQLACESDEQGLYDIRPPCNPQRPTGMGLDNAYKVNPETGRAFGVELYPGGMPGFFASGVKGLQLNNVNIFRPDALPEGWNKKEIVQVNVIS